MSEIDQYIKDWTNTTRISMDQPAFTYNETVAMMRGYAMKKQQQALNIASSICQVEVDQYAILDLKSDPELFI